MPAIELGTYVHAPVSRCFDLARSIDLHKISTKGTDEEAIAGVTKGLIGAGQCVTWRARHFGIRQTLTSCITRFRAPYYFRDEMVDGPFKSIVHDHRFIPSGDGTLVQDWFHFESPGWILGLAFNKLVLTDYLRRVLRRRNEVIKAYAEGEGWLKILNGGVLTEDKRDL